MLWFGPCPVAFCLLLSRRNANLARGFAGRLGFLFCLFCSLVVLICLFSRTNCVPVQNCFSLLTLLSGPSLSATSAIPEDTLQDRDKGEPVSYVSRVLPFGASASVHHFPRFSAFLHAAGLRMGLCWAAYFDDFAILTHQCHEKSSLHAALGLF